MPRNIPFSHQVLSLTIALFSAFSYTASAHEQRSNYDIDGDGLIELNTAADFFDIYSVRNYEVVGASLNGFNDGCPADGCIGYELTADIDFEADPEENSLRTPLPFFSGVLEGNGHWLRNFRLLGGGTVSLFLELDSAIIRNLNLGGEREQRYLFGSSNSGALASIAYDSVIDNCSFTGTISASSNSGGLVGVMYDSLMVNSRANVTMLRNGYLDMSGGLVGAAYNSTFIANAVEVDIPQGQYLGGLIGVSEGNTISASYSTGTLASDSAEEEYNGFVGVSTDTRIDGSYSTLEVSRWPSGVEWAFTYSVPVVADAGDGSSESPELVSLAELTCPTAANSDSCADTTLYYNWDQYQDVNGKPYWSFGDDQTLPYLNTPLAFDYDLGFIDADGDGTIDWMDDFENNAAADRDSDRDGYPDYWLSSCDLGCQAQSGLALDAFPEHSAAAVDEDQDGLPDAWNDGCDAACRLESGLTLDNSTTSAVAGSMNLLLLALFTPLAVCTLAIRRRWRSTPKTR